MAIQYVMRHGLAAVKTQAVEIWREGRHGMTTLKTQDEEVNSRDGTDDDDEAGALLVDDEGSLEALDLVVVRRKEADEKLSLRETAWLSLEFCMLWFVAN